MKLAFILGGAIKDVLWNIGPLSKALALPFSVIILISVLFSFELSPLSELLLIIFGGIVQAVLAVVVHRVLILGKNAVPQWGITKLSKREASFFLHAFFLSFLAIPFLPLLFIPGVGWVLCLIGTSWLMGRLSLALPGVAVEGGVFFNESWKITRGYQITITLTTMVAIAATYGPRGLSLLGPEMAVLSIIASAIGTILAVAVLSRAYLLMVNTNGPNTGGANL
ncbi:hypothetical protein BTO32_01675 [Marinobacter lutaoensis]|uniref:Uncharacterized protein n=1 Tax=Marinobacter lutaoensis TaxID=135739 RepID=A0A1V2DXH0_9GAMM|nr:hypothetical protein [Marinobacter lutaoensis]ONF45207.1 hypothetical protein BTO32_01675 [Marinobacter lutaoensis]